MTKTKVLIVGGGFGGIKAALELTNDDNCDVTLLTEHKHFRYYPSLYRTATGGNPSGSSIPLESIFQNKSIQLVFDSVKTLQRDHQTIVTNGHQTFTYDILVLALGVVTNYFGIKGLQEYSFGIKSLEDTSEFKNHLHQQLIDTHKTDLNYVIVGGGPTGIELAGELPGYLMHISKKHQLTHPVFHIDLVEAAPHLLPRLPKKIGKKVEGRLRSLGIRLYLGQAVQGETADALMVNGKPITSHTVVWTAGVTNHPFFKNNNFKISDHGKVIVDKYLQAEPNIYVIGDNADTEYSGMAQTAVYDGKYVGYAIRNRLLNKNIKTYKPRKPIYVTPVGPKWAAVLWGQIQLFGWLGWLIHEFADVIAFHDLEPWWKASQQWITEFTSEESCPVCTQLVNSSDQ